MRRILVPVCLLALSVLPGAPALAQRTTGNITGTVTDEQGAVLPGVTVLLKGEAIVGVQTGVTNEKGTYHFAALPPGDYTLTFSLSGFGTENHLVRASVGVTREENCSLKVTQRSEEVTVSGEAAVIDAGSNQVSTTYDKDWVRNAPVPRFSFFDLINAAPGVNQNASGDPRSTSFGGGTTDNSYQLDGTDFTAPYTGEAWPYPNTDAIEEIEVLSLGAPAEYGNLQGAVFNVVTRQGSNQFHGDANFYLQTQGLTANNTSDITLKDQFGNPFFADACPSDSSAHCPFKREKFQDMTFQLSGPVIQDKLWFFASYQRQRDSQAPAGTDPTFPAQTQADRVFFKANWQIDAKNKVQFAYHDDYYWLPYPVVACNTLDAPSSCNVEHGHNPSPNLTFTSVRSDKTYFEVRVSGFYGSDHGDPLQSGEPRIEPRYKNKDTGEVTGGIYSWYDGNSDKTAVSAKVSHFADNFLGGSHDFKFGVQYNKGGHNYVFGPNDYIYTYSDGSTYGFTQAPYHTGGQERTIALFVDDAYAIGSRVTLNLGLRYDNARASFEAQPILDRNGNPTGQMSQAVPDLFTWNNVSPRVGFSWRVTKDGKTALKGHYGRYYRGIITGEFDALSPSRSAIYSFSGQYDAQGNPLGLAFISNNSQLSIDPNFKAPYTDQYIAQFEREITHDLGVSLNYIHKQGQNYGAYEDTGGIYAPVAYPDTEGALATGGNINVLQLQNSLADRQFILTNPSAMYSRYNGGTLQVVKRMSHNWEATASLVVSKSTGRLPSSLGGPSDEQAGASVPGVKAFGQDPNDYLNTNGLLIGDRPVTTKAQVVYQFPWGILVSANYVYQTGRPWSRQIDVSNLVNLPRSLPLAAPIDGSLRVAAWNILDMRFQKQVPLRKGAKLDLFLDILNLTNDAAYDSVGDRLGTSEAFGLPTAYIPPRRGMLGAKVTF